MNRKLKKILVNLVCVIMVFVSTFVIYNGITVIDNNKAHALDYDQIVDIQQRLYDWGYYTGSINGVYDNATIEAIKDFQVAHGINPSGNVDSATADALGVYVTQDSSSDLYLLAKCIHAEARGEIYVGKVAVGAVILNRVASPDFPNTIYGVIYQPWAFTAVHDGQINLEPDSSAYQAAQDALNGWDPTYGCLFYYNPAVATSSWIFSRQVVTTIGKHVFAI